jgi:hypothetical protein
MERIAFDSKVKKLLKSTLMKKISFLLLVLVTGTLVYAQKPTKDSMAVANAVEALRNAMLDPTATNLMALTSPLLSYGHSGGAIDDQQLFIEKLVSGKSDFVELNFTNQSITMSGDVALVRHELHAKINDGGKPGEVHLKVLLVWQWQKAGWLLLARQAVKMQ